MWAMGKERELSFADLGFLCLVLWTEHSHLLELHICKGFLKKIQSCFAYVESLNWIEKLNFHGKMVVKICTFVKILSF